MIRTNSGTPMAEDIFREGIESRQLSVPIDSHSHLPEIGVKIGRLQLTDRLDKRQSLKRSNKSSVVPILRLPPEITSAIFIKCLPEPDHAGFHPEPSLDTAPLMLGRICSQWRVVAWSTPILWRSLSLQLYQERLDLDAWLIKSWLARSSQYSLSLRLICDDAEEDEAWESHSASVALDAIIPHSHRWEQIDFFLPMQDFVSLSTVIYELPLLKRLKIGRTSYPEFLNEMPEPEEAAGVFCDAPQLQDAALIGCDPSIFPLPWGQLVRLWAKDLLVRECLEILEQTANLVECAFLPLAGFGYERHYPTVQLSHLSGLKVSGAAGQIGKLLDCLTLPALEVIEVKGQADAWRDMNIPSFLTRSSCLLRSILINRTRFGRGEFAGFLRQVPSLVELKVESYSTIDGFLLDLVAPSMGNGHSPALVPMLRDISLSGLSFSVGTLVTMLSSRWKTDDAGSFTIACLRSCKINISSFGILDDSEGVSQLRAMVGDGLILHIEGLDSTFSQV